MEFFDSLRVCGCWCKRVQFGLLYASCLGHLIMLYCCEVGTVKAHLVYSEVGQLSGKLVQAFVEDWQYDDLQDDLRDWFECRGLMLSIVVSAGACSCTGIGCVTCALCCDGV